MAYQGNNPALLELAAAGLRYRQDEDLEFPNYYRDLDRNENGKEKLAENKEEREREGDRSPTPPPFDDRLELLVEIAKRGDQNKFIILGALQQLGLQVEDLDQKQIDRMADRKGGVKPHMFYGKKDEDAEDWLALYECYFAFNRNRAADVRHAFGMYLGGSARDWYNDHSISRMDNWDNIKEEFCNFFTKLTPTQKRELAFVKMKQGEDIKEFNAKISKAFRKLELGDEAKKSRYLEAITPIYRIEVEKGIIAMEDVPTYSDLIKISREAGEKLEIYDRATGVSADQIEGMIGKMTKSLKEEIKRSEGEKDKITVSQISEKVSRHFDDKFKKYSREADERFKRYSKGAPGIKPKIEGQGGGDRGFRPSGRFQGRDHSDLVCFRCGELGHIMLNCPLKDTKRSITCYFCGEKGHYSRECPILQEMWKNKRTQGHQSRSNSNGGGNSSRSRTPEGN